MDEAVIAHLYEELLRSLADLNQVKQVVHHAFKREFEILESYDSDSFSEIVSREAFIFDNPFTGIPEKYGFRSASVEDLKRLTYWHKNSQYCWLLMSAFEKFEEFLKASYREITGRVCKTLNPMLVHFSENYPGIKAAEMSNAFGVNLRVAVHLVEKMRHAIAHSQGTVENPEKFVAKVINDSGIGASRRDHEAFVSQFISESKIFIVEVPANNNPSFPLFYDQYRILVSYLISYAYLVRNEAS